MKFNRGDIVQCIKSGEFWEVVDYLVDNETLCVANGHYQDLTFYEYEIKLVCKAENREDLKNA